MTFSLYDYQTNVIDRMRSSVRAGFKRPCVVSPTGSGKTVMFAYLTGKLAESRKRVIILNHRRELSDQIHSALDEFGVAHDVIESGVKYYNPRRAVHVASAFLVVRRLPKLQVPDYVIVDEAHHAIGGSTWGRILEYWQLHNPAMVTFGFTATPERLSGEGLEQTFDHLILGPTVRELIDAGRLSDYTMFAPPASQAVDLAGVHRRMGDFVRAEAEAAMDKPKITGCAIDHYRKHLNGAPTLVFCASVKHAESVCAEFKAAGYRAVSVDGGMADKDRRQATGDFGRGQLNIMTSCDLISEGYDVPGAVGCINLRPTDSLALCLQQWGRVLRVQAGKERAVILDHVGNSQRHGLPDDDREWTLKGRDAKRKPRDPDDIAIRQCPGCGCINNAYVKKCRDCGREFVAVRVREVEQVDGELQQVDPRVASLQFRRQRAAANDLDALVEIGRMRGMQNPEGWARHVLKARDEKQRRQA